jgi:hypothetical protein
MLPFVFGLMTKSFMGSSFQGRNADHPSPECPTDGTSAGSLERHRRLLRSQRGSSRLNLSLE